MQNIKDKGHLVQKIVETDMDERTDMTDCSTMPANAVDI